MENVATKNGSTPLRTVLVLFGDLGIYIKKHGPYPRITWYCPGLWRGGSFGPLSTARTHLVISVRQFASLSVDLVRRDVLVYVLSWLIPSWPLWSVVESQWGVCVEPRPAG